MAGSWQLERRLVFKPSISGQEMDKLFGGSDDVPLPSRMLLRASSANGYDQDVAWVRRAHGSSWLVEQLSTTTASTADDLTIQAVRAGFARTATGVHGSDALSPQPWIFRKRGEGWQMVGEGSAKRREPELRVVVDKDAIVSDGQRIGPLDDHKMVWKLRRATTIIQGGERFTVVPGADQDDTIESFLTGKVVSFGGRQDRLFKGPPSMRVQKNGGVILVKRPQELQWRRKDRTWGALTDCPGGRVQVRAEVGDGDHVIRWAKILPADFWLELAPGSVEEGGRISVKGRTVQQIGSREHLDLERHQTSPLELRLKPRRDQVPATVPLFVLFRGGGADLTVDVPVPIVRKRFEDATGTPLPRNHTVSLMKLGQLRAVCSLPRSAPHLLVNLRLRDSGGQRWDAGSRVAPSGLGVTVLEMRDFRERIEHLLNLSSDLDAVVQVDLEENRTRLPTQSLQVTRYDTQVVPDKVAGTVALEGSIPGNEQFLRETQVDAVPLTRPEEVVPLAAMVSGGKRSWLFEPDARVPGPWLVTATHPESTQVSRPVLWIVHGDEEAVDTVDEPSLGGFIAAPLRRDARQARLATRLQFLATEEPRSDEWHLVHEALKLGTRVPAGALDLVCALAAVPDAAAWAIATLESTHQQACWDTLADLPFLWELVSKQTWRACFEGLKRDLESRGVPPSVSLGVVQSLVRPILDNGVAPNLAFHEMKPDFSGQRLNAMMLRGILKPAMDALLRRHTEGRWPEPQERESFYGAARPIRETLKSLGIPGQQAFRHLVLAAPFISAGVAASTVQRLTPNLVLDLRRAKEFDEIWFEDAYYYTFLALASQ